MKKNSIFNILLIIIISFLLFILICLIYKDYININEKQTKTTLEYDLEYCKKKYSNSDIIGRLKIEGTDIDTLLVKSTNNEYYLNHSINKEEDIKGSIFVDYRTNLNSNQINIYGHNSKEYELPFKELEKYKTKDFYEKHKIIELWNGSETYYYQIFSIQIIFSSDEHMNINPLDLEKHILSLNKSIYDTGISANKNDKILVLQTCNYSEKNSYLLVIAKKI